MNDENSTIRSLHELKTLFDSGAITAEEYEALKKRIIYGATATTEPKSAEPIAPSSPQSVEPIERKVIYPSQSAPPEPPVIPPPVTEQKLLPRRRKRIAGGSEARASKRLAAHIFSGIRIAATIRFTGLSVF